MEIDKIINGLTGWSLHSLEERTDKDGRKSIVLTFWLCSCKISIVNKFLNFISKSKQHTCPAGDHSKMIKLIDWNGKEFKIITHNEIPKNYAI